ncbi:sulfatase-like hydrolase/transferase [Desulfofustis limnaeus]|jgi:membrane-anchored protein YejM (alkaline phosphatase superfamily)|uniref:Sulfatase N-terminal domain-containing protein n=1 Tax=Desulfofustis limnaeus TaxID=2740163 RepID=A0ABM7W443_9BACT|nr:sulfatase-like hydrolase/transferase [Desulfofustis limnaeus]MDX9894704.1 sulfatase-like hydrolase/transferase [Desulfofustis sp.]BDD85682.1 hypothetical protein DPPLL_00470 [Desulfofustis limnaeus]
MRLRFLFISLALALFILVSVSAIKQIERQTAAGIIILTVEGLQGALVNQQQMPRLSAAAAQGGLRLPEHRVESGGSGSTIVSLLTGLSSLPSNIPSQGQPLYPPVMTPLHQLTDRGFVVVGLQPFMTKDVYAHLGLTVMADNGDPLFWLARQKQQGVPFLLWYHYVEPPREPSLQQEEVTDFDAWFGRLWDHLQKSGLHRSTCLVVTADHGEVHTEQDRDGRVSPSKTSHLQDETVRLPLIIWAPQRYRSTLPDAEAIGRSSPMDLMPTLFGLFDIEPETTFDGRDLLRTPADNSRSRLRLKREALP